MLLIIPLLAFLFSCEEGSKPTSVDELTESSVLLPSSKVVDNSDEIIIAHWECDADSKWTLFYKDVLFRVKNNNVIVYDYENDLQIYQAPKFTTEDFKHSAQFLKEGSNCGIVSDLFDKDDEFSILWNDSVIIWHYGESSASFRLIDSDFAPISWYKEDGRIVPIDLRSSHHREGPQPPKESLTFNENGYKGFYLPFNIDISSDLSILDTFEFSEDLRPNLNNIFCVGNDCPQGLIDDIEIQLIVEEPSKELDEISSEIYSDGYDEGSSYVEPSIPSSGGPIVIPDNEPNSIDLAFDPSVYSYRVVEGGSFNFTRPEALGGSKPIDYRLSSGSSAGLTASNSSVSGNPTEVGTSTFVWIATDSNGSTARFTLNVNVQARGNSAVVDLFPNFNRPSVNRNATYKSLFSYTRPDASSGDAPLTYSVSPTSLNGLTANSTGVSGIVNRVGTSSFTWTVTDSDGDQSTFTLNVIVPGPVCSTDPPRTLLYEKLNHENTYVLPAITHSHVGADASYHHDEGNSNYGYNQVIHTHIGSYSHTHVDYVQKHRHNNRQDSNYCHRHPTNIININSYPGGDEHCHEFGETVASDHGFHYAFVSQDGTEEDRTHSHSLIEKYKLTVPHPVISDEYEGLPSINLEGAPLRHAHTLSGEDGVHSETHSSKSHRHSALRITLGYLNESYPWNHRHDRHDNNNIITSMHSHPVGTEGTDWCDLGSTASCVFSGNDGSASEWRCN